MAMDLDLQTGKADLYLTFDHEKAQAMVPSVAIETSMCFVATLHRLSLHKAQGPSSRVPKV